MNQDWEIKAREKVCAGTGRPFADGEAVYSQLLFTREGYRRFDYSEEFWKQSPPADRVGFWKGSYHEPPPPTPEALKRESAESLLRKLMEGDDPSAGNTIYILAVMLERKKIFIERDVQIRPDGQKIRLYEHKLTGESFIIPDPQLRLSQLTQVQTEVIARLEGQQPAAPAPAPGGPTG